MQHINRSFFVYKLQTVVLLCKTKPVTPRIITEKFQQLQQERDLSLLSQKVEFRYRQLCHPVNISKAHQKVKHAISFEQLNFPSSEKKN
jgi:hypothetical protein